MSRDYISVALGDVERQISNRFKWLRFEPAIEVQFERDVGPERCRHMIRQNYIALFIYHLFLFSDYRSIGDVFQLDLFVHFLIVTPVTFAVNTALARHPRPWLRETLEMGPVIILTMTIVWVVLASRAPDRDLVLLCITMVVLFPTMMQRMRFWYVLPTNLVVLALYGLGLSGFDTISAERLSMSVSLVLGIVLFSLVGAYHLECEQRMGYLLRLRERLRNRELEITSLRDSLTGIGNRRALELALLEATRPNLPQAARSVAILLLDIDHFKRFNDTNGHQQGDLCLARVAGLVAASLPYGGGEAYRFGGEEFLVLLTGTTLRDALLVAQRIRAAVEEARISAGPGAGNVTVSIGVAAGIAGVNATSHSLVAAADAALYVAKARGRNRVWASTDEAETSIAMTPEHRLAG